jgi:hypothetical protein
VIGPALKGTISILQSAVKNGCVFKYSFDINTLSNWCNRYSVKRVVVTSSCAAVLHVSPEPKIFSEVDWNDQSVKQVEEQGRKALGVAKYRASKTLAERGTMNCLQNDHEFLLNLIGSKLHGISIRQTRIKLIGIWLLLTLLSYVFPIFLWYIILILYRYYSGIRCKYNYAAVTRTLCSVSLPV